MTNAERLADQIFALIERTSPRGLVRSELVALIEREVGNPPMTASEAIARQAAHLEDIQQAADRMVNPPVVSGDLLQFDKCILDAWASLGKVPETEYIATTGERASALAWQVRSGMAEQWARAQVAKNWPDESVVDVQVFGNLQDAELVCLVHHTRSGIPKAMVRKMHVKVDELK